MTSARSAWPAAWASASVMSASLMGSTASMNNTPPGERNVPPSFTVARLCRRNAIVMEPSARPGQNRAGNSMGEFVYHFSEDPTIEVFAPRVAPTQQVAGAYVWAADDTRL